MLKKQIFVGLLFLSFLMGAQEKLMVKGYVKGMTIMQTVGEDGEMSLENVVHNRFDVNWFINDKLTFLILPDNLLTYA